MFFQLAGLVLLVAMIGAIVLTSAPPHWTCQTRTSRIIGRTREVSLSRSVKVDLARAVDDGRWSF